MQCDRPVEWQLKKMKVFLLCSSAEEYHGIPRSLVKINGKSPLYKWTEKLRKVNDDIEIFIVADVKFQPNYLELMIDSDLQLISYDERFQEEIQAVLLELRIALRCGEDVVFVRGDVAPEVGFEMQEFCCQYRKMNKELGVLSMVLCSSFEDQSSIINFISAANPSSTSLFTETFGYKILPTSHHRKMSSGQVNPSFNWNKNGVMTFCFDLCEINAIHLQHLQQFLMENRGEKATVDNLLKFLVRKSCNVYLTRLCRLSESNWTEMEQERSPIWRPD